MQRLEAVEQYNAALRAGKKYYSAAMARGEDPYLRVLDDLISGTTTTAVNIGLVEIPTGRIVGTWAAGRKTAFAGDFMPLLDMTTEFGDKWINLCTAHLGSGITDPIKCFEYLGEFYVQEGHKRVSVLKSFDAPAVPGMVTRLVPALTDDPKIRLYYEFLHFYKVAGVYIEPFSAPGGYAKLLAALGCPPDRVWTAEERKEFNGDYLRFAAAFHQLNAGEKLSVTASDALLVYLSIHSLSEMSYQGTDKIRADLNVLWPDVRLLAKGEPVSISASPEQKDPGLLGRILPKPKLHVVFIYDFDPEKSVWAAAHRQGQAYLEEKLGDSVTITACLCGENADEAMEDAVAKGANVIFATTPTLMDACRRLAVRHKNVAVFNCSLSMPYTGVRSYYCRIYEGKFIAGAIAGAMAGEDRIGYVANYPILGVPAAINAFALGARLTNPRVRISLRWSCLEGNPILDFKNEGIPVISNRDEDGANTGLGWEMGTYMVTGDGGLMSLASPRWNWGSYYEKTVRALIAGGVESLRDATHAVTDWWGMNTGVVNVDLAEDMPDSMKQLAQILRSGIIEGRIDPFLCVIRDQRGNVISDGTRVMTYEELIGMDWLCENVDGIIPEFDALLPRSRKLVRLLGIHRDAIPPETKEVP